MKWIHIGDLHIGKLVHEFSMLEDQKYILNQILEIADEEKVDGIFIAGDIYDRSIPPAEAVTLFDFFLTELMKRDLTVCMISGNHDSPERISFAEKIMEKSKLYIAASLKEGIKKVTCKDEYGNLNIYCLPFAKPSVMKYWLASHRKESDKKEKEESNYNYEYFMKRLIDTCNIDEKERNILISHYFVINGRDKPLLSDSEVQINVGGIDEVNGSLFDLFDYVALGHIHRPQKIGRETMRYCGSPLKYSFSEAFHNKSITIVDIKEKGNISVSQIPLRPKHDMRIIKGKLSDLLEDSVVDAADRNDFIQAILTDEDALFEPMDKLRTVYPNIMQMIKEKDITRDGVKEYDFTSLEKKDSFQLYKEFYESVTDRLLDEQREQIIRNIINEILGEEV